ncbi:MAG: two-component system response regulator AtoC [Myxococcota bacterium]|jgi:two-component system response regulator AtoC
MADLIIVEDERVLRRTLERNLRGHGHEVRAFESAEDAVKSLVQAPPNLLLTDHRLPGMTGLDLLQIVKSDYPSIPVVLLTAHGTVEDAVAAMRAGAADYLRKPIDLDELEIVVERNLRAQAMSAQLDYFREKQLGGSCLDGIIGTSQAILKLRQTIRRVAALVKRDGEGPTVLLQGETGTGKGLVARALHAASPRAGKPMIEVNCTAIPEELLEAEIMGYERGAFTDAKNSKLGLLEAAEGGTIFFDEIGHMSPKLQAKLLKIVEERVIRRLGSTRDRTISCTVFTATHMDLEAMVREGSFREDLYHRINVVRVMLPALRDREGDVLDLANHFLTLHAADYGMGSPELTDDAKNAVRAYAWPGNVRELSHAIERALVLSEGNSLDTRSLGLGGATHETVSTAPAAVGLDSIDVDFSSGPLSLERIEESLFRAALAEAAGSKTEAGRLLGISRDTFRYRFAKYESS